MIAKITRGSRPGDIAAYLHGPGHANEHRDGDRVGGRVVGGNLGREGETDGGRWAADLRAAVKEREDIKNPVWQMSLRSAPGDRRLSDREWAAAGQTVAERMGYAEHPWVMVRHADDHVHIVASRVSERGEVWHARQDFRNAQRAATEIENQYGLTQAPRQKAQRGTRVSDQEVHAMHQEQQQQRSTARVTAAERVRSARGDQPESSRTVAKRVQGMEAIEKQTDRQSREGKESERQSLMERFRSQQADRKLEQDREQER